MRDNMINNILYVKPIAVCVLRNKSSKLDYSSTQTLLPNTECNTYLYNLLIHV